MKVQINSLDDLQAFCMRSDITAVDAINVFERYFSGADVVCISLVDVQTKKPCLTKSKVINEITKFIDLVKGGGKYRSTAIFFN